MGAGRLALPVLALGWLLLALHEGLSPVDVLAGALAVTIGLLLPVLRSRGVARRTGEDGLDGRPGRGTMDALGVLDALAAELEADRVIVWELEPDDAELTPVIGTGTLPRSVPVTGSPLAWAAAEGRAVRLDPAPGWAIGACTVAPIDDRSVLSAERVGEPVEPRRLDRAAAFAAAVRSIEARERRMDAEERRLTRALELLRSLPREADPGRVPHALARAAVELTQGRGALVGAWQDDHGVVLATVGEGGGPAPGIEFGPVDGDLGHAARTGVSFSRGPADRTGRPLAVPSEVWEGSTAAHRTVLPLAGPDRRVEGLLAVWSDRPLATQGVGLLEALGPAVAVQLRQATDLVRFRARATLDALTGLPNRGALEERMAEETARFYRYRRPLAAVVVDLDHFKGINDRHGHEAGDAVLRTVSRILAASVRDADFVARFGGEEMVVLLPETLLHPAMEAAERIRAAIAAARIEHDGVVIPVTASLGVSACPECVEDPDGLFKSADTALYTSKETGRDRVTAAGMRLV